MTASVFGFRPSSIAGARKGALLLAVDLGMTEEALTEYLQEGQVEVLREGGSFDSEEDWIPSPHDADLAWYCIPASLLNSTSSIHLIPHEGE